MSNPAAEVFQTPTRHQALGYSWFGDWRELLIWQFREKPSRHVRRGMFFFWQYVADDAPAGRVPSYAMGNAMRDSVGAMRAAGSNALFRMGDGRLFPKTAPPESAANRRAAAGYFRDEFKCWYMTSWVAKAAIRPMRFMAVMGVG